MRGRRSTDIEPRYAAVDYLHVLLAPRHGPHVTLRSVTPESLALYELLHQLQQREAVTLEYRTIPFAPFAPKLEPSPSDVYKWEVWTFTMQRRSKELRDLAWSGYRYLQNLYPEHRLETSKSGVPFVYLHRGSGTALTAGNIDVSFILEAVVQDEISQLLLVADPGKWRAEEPDVSRQPLLDVAVLTFDEPARAALERLFRKQDEALLAAVRS